MATFLDACYSLQSDSQSEVDAALQFIRTDPKFRATMEAAMKTSSKDTISTEDKSVVLDDKALKISEETGINPTQASTPNAAGSSQTVASQGESLVELPKQHVAFIAISNFYSCAGMLFHSFPREMGFSIWRDVYSNGSHNSPVKLAQMFSIIAIGCQYSRDQASLELGKTSYQIAKSFLEDALEDDRLQATRIISCLILFNIMNKNTVALSYVELGLGIFARHGFNRLVQPLRVEQRVWKEMKKVWRTFVFLESWLTSTLGYVPELLMDHCANNVLQDMHMHDDPVEPFSETVQAEMAKISILAARVVRALYSDDSPDTTALDTVSKHLRTWYNGIPRPMRDEGLAVMDLRSEHTVPIYFIRLIHLGAVMLLYRRVMSDAVLDAEVPNVRPTGEAYQQTAMYANEGMDAARSSARMLDILLDAQLIFRRCWLVIYHSFTSAVIIMHGVARNLAIEPAANPSTRTDLELAHHCLRLLAFSAELDAVAEQFFLTLAPYYDFLLAQVGEVSLPLSSTLNVGSHSQTGTYNTPTCITSATEFLFDIVRKPFGEPGLARSNESDPLLRPFQPDLPSFTRPIVPSEKPHPHKYDVTLEPPPPKVAPPVPPFKLDMNIGKPSFTVPKLGRLHTYPSYNKGIPAEARRPFKDTTISELRTPPRFRQHHTVSSPSSTTASLLTAAAPYFRKLSVPDHLMGPSTPAGSLISNGWLQPSSWNTDATQGLGKRRRYDKPLEGHKRLGSPDSGYVSYERVGSFSSADHAASVISLSDDRRGSVFSESSRRASLRSDAGRRTSVDGEFMRIATSDMRLPVMNDEGIVEDLSGRTMSDGQISVSSLICPTLGSVGLMSTDGSNGPQPGESSVNGSAFPRL